MKPYSAAMLIIAIAVLTPAGGAEPTTDRAALEPAVQTSTAAAPPAASAPAPAPGGARQGPATGATTARPANAARRASGKQAMDSIELDSMEVRGNREMPNVMYIVPWKKPDIGDFAGRPPKSLLDEVLAPVDREVFQRQNRYFAALQPDAAASGAPPAAPAGQAPAAPASGPVSAPVSGDEK